MSQWSLLRTLLVSTPILVSCMTVEPPSPKSDEAAVAALDTARSSSVFGPATAFEGSPLDGVGRSGLYPVRGPDECEVAVLDSGEGSFAARLQTLKAAKVSIRIQALVFKGDESGLRIAELASRK